MYLIIYIYIYRGPFFSHVYGEIYKRRIKGLGERERLGSEDWMLWIRVDKFGVLSTIHVINTGRVLMVPLLFIYMSCHCYAINEKWGRLHVFTLSSLLFGDL